MQGLALHEQIMIRLFSKVCSIGLWQSFIIIGLFQRMPATQKKRDFVNMTINQTGQSNMSCQKLTVFLANNKTIHSPNSRHCYFYSLEFVNNFYYRYYLLTYLYRTATTKPE